MKRILLALALAVSFAVAQTDPSGNGGTGNPQTGSGGMMGGTGTSTTGYGTTMMGGQSMAALGKVTGQEFDAAWMSQMVGHHEVAILMSAVELAHGRVAKVRDAARKIIEAQTGEIVQMQNWLQAWYGAPPSKAHLGLMMTDLAGMMPAMTGAAMNDPDKTFLTLMIPHHQGAVDMAKVALRKANHAQLKAMAQKVIADQSREIQEFQSWLKGM
ncbi:MAG TPA: DUF305 domain-containing protein [Deinococcales bacterium]|nr:DUF305 domain-containing protein [Deinococcales bacterium]